MIRLDINGSGVELIIVGCPFCDKGENIRFYNSKWYLDPEMDHGKYSIKITYCPQCGNLLPNLVGWVIKNDSAKIG